MATASGAAIYNGTESEERLNPSKLEAFLASLEKRAFRIARFSCGDDEEALDIVQEAMLAFVRNYAAKSEEEWRPLFHRVLGAKIKDWARRSAVRSCVRRFFGGDDEGAAPEEFPHQGPGPEDALSARQAGTAIEAAVRSLPARQRQAFLLRSWEGLDVAETALAMGCSEGSVKTHHHRAVHTLRRLLEDLRP